MKLAVLERFADPSRRCEPASIGSPEDEMLVWDLSGPVDEPWTFLRGVPAGLWSWLRSPL